MYLVEVTLIIDKIPKASPDSTMAFLYNKPKIQFLFQYLPIKRPTIISGTIWKKFPTICNLETSS